MKERPTHRIASLPVRSKFIAIWGPVCWNGLSFTRQVGLPLFCKGILISEHRPDLVVENKVVVEVKRIARFENVHVAQLLTYLRVTSIHVGLLLNFNTSVLKHGIRRIVL